MLAPAIASDKLQRGFVGDIVTDRVRWDARFEGPASVLVYWYGKYRHLWGVLILVGLAGW